MIGSASSKLAIVAMAALCSAACSSAGGNAPSGGITQTAAAPPPPPSPPPAPVSFDTNEYRSQSALAQINALPAYDTGGSGAGVIVGIIDTGIDVNNPEFQGRIHPQSADLVIAGIVANSELRAGGPTLQDSDAHGTQVASILGAARDDIGVHGVAPETQLLIFRTDDESSTETLLGDAIAEGVARSANIGAGVLNFSFGSDGPTARAEYADIFDFTKKNDIVVVASAGNDGAADPDGTALGALDVPGKSATIIAGSVNASGDISGFSNRAGAAADIYLLAPGEFISTTFVGAQSGDRTRFSGASAATPHIAGAAAIIRQLWPQLSATEVVDILLTSATDLGAAGADPIYGRGLLNLGAATAPLGTVTTKSASGTVSDVTTLGAQLSPAFGSGLSELTPIVVFDGFNRDFRTDINAVVHAAAPDQFEIETALSPFTDYTYARQRISERMTADIQLTSRDRSLTDFSSRNQAGFSDGAKRGDFTEDKLAVALTSEIGAGRSITIAQGYTAMAVDRIGLETRRTPFASQSLFNDAYLPEVKGEITAVMRSALSSRITVDFLATHADDFYSATVLSPADEKLRGDQRVSAFRAGVNIDLPRLHLRVEQGFRREVGAIFNASFGDHSGASTFYGALDADWTLSRHWRIKTRYAAGYSFADTAGFGDLIDGFSGLTTSQFSLALVRHGLISEADSLWLGASQPLQIQSGAVRMTLPTGYNQFTETLSFSTIVAPLAAPQGRYDFEAGYRLHVGQLGSVDLNLIHQTFAQPEIKGSTTLIMRSGFKF